MELTVSVPLSDRPNPCMVGIYVKATPHYLGCHGQVLNDCSVSCNIPFLSGFGEKTFAQLKEYYNLVPTKNRPLHIPKDMEEQEFRTQVSERIFKNNCVYLSDLPESSQKQLAKHIAEGIARYSCTIFVPILNYGLPSRGSTSHEHDGTAAMVQLLMKYYPEGSWYGVPAMMNAGHSKSFGTAMSFFQVILWNRIPKSAEILKSSKFQLHQKGSGKWGPLIGVKDFLEGATGAQKFLNERGSNEEALQEGTYFSFRKLAESLGFTGAKL